jgi:DNA-binding NarL/FixJ family response regulator
MELLSDHPTAIYDSPALLKRFTPSERGKMATIGDESNPGNGNYTAPANATNRSTRSWDYVSSFSVLVVEDFEPFRRLVCSMLARERELRIVGEASDGLEALQQAAELQPDLILLDIGLPGLHGIEAARRIRKLSPRSRIIFVSQESSADVAEEAFSLGAMGYVVKAHAGSELLDAVAAVQQGRQFVSRGLTGQSFSNSAIENLPDSDQRKLSASGLRNRALKAEC